MQLLALVQVLVIVVAFLLGRASVSSVEASPASEELQAPAAVVPNEAPPPNAVPSAAATNAQIDTLARTASEQALLDTRNVYTIKVVEYFDSESNRRLAQATWKYLTETQRLPAVIATKGTRVFILVGAAPAQVDFDALLARVKSMSGPPPMSKAGEFYDAYLEKIDKVFPRK